MKAFHILAAGFALCAAFASCEMKDELKGINDGTNGDTGYLELGVAVNGSLNNVTTKADVEDDGTQTGTSVSADDFPVVITGVTDASYKKEFASYTALKAEGAIVLPVGTYTIAAHSNKVLEENMTEPYYDGTANVNITKGSTVQAEVLCKMKNTKISMSYANEFTSRFQSWTITVTDGKAILEFVCASKTSEELNPAPLYMWVQEGVSELTVRVSAVNLKGETVREARTLAKPAGGNSSAWTGGDALTITMSGYDPKPDVETGIQGSGITIDADVTFDESEDVVEVPVTPGSGDDNTDPVGPGTGDDEEEEPVTSNLPTVTMPRTTYTLPDDMEADADVLIEKALKEGSSNEYVGLKSVFVKIIPGNTEADADVLIETALKEGSSNEYVGLKSVFVKIIPGNDGFTAALDLIKDVADFSVGVELVGNTALEPMLQFIAPDLKVPAENASSYTFPVGAFFATLQDIGATTAADGHVFEIVVTDNNGNSPSEPTRLSVFVEEPVTVE